MGRTPGRVLLVAASLGICAVRAAAADSPTFTDDVAPILRAHCVACHQPEGPAPFSLLTYSDARRHARQIAEVTAKRIMPPWNAEAGANAFVGQTRPGADQIATLQRWASEGAPEGRAGATPTPVPTTNGWQLGQPDLIVTLPEAYTLASEGADVFRIFVLPIPGDTARFVRGLEFRPGNAAVVHHVNIRLDRSPASRQRDADDPAPGYDGLLARTALFPDGHFLGWTPGQTAPLLPPGLAWRLEPGTDLVLQVHMQPDGKREAVRPSVGLFFGDDPPVPRLTMLRLGKQNIDIAAGEAAYTISDSYRLPVDVEIQAVQPHAHYRARDVRGDAVLPDGRVVPLIHISDWNFRWQHLYRYVTPVALPKGTTISMRYVYDNSSSNPRNPTQPPVEAVWGQRSIEEMGDLWLQAMTRTEADLLALNRDFRPKAVSEDLVGYERLIQRAPLDVGLRDDAAVLYLELGRPGDAAAHWQQVTRIQPTLASAHFNLATALVLAGRTEAAIGELNDAVRLNPHYTRAHGQLGRLLLQRGEASGAKRHLTTALADQPLDPELHYSLGLADRALGDRTAAIDSLRTAARLAPSSVAIASDLAWILATNNTVTSNDAAEAVVLAERAVALTGRRDGVALDVLGVALAAAQQFERAVDTANEALALVTDTTFAEQIRTRRTLYLRRTPFTIGDRNNLP